MGVLRALKATAVALAALAMTASAQAVDITGAGSTFVFPILSKWSADYSAKTGNRINYQSIGSGGGLAQIRAATIDFGASDAPMKPEDLQTLGMGQFPLVIGGIVPTLNIDGVQPGQILFTGSLLADIYLGKVTNWNDPAIAKLNRDLKLPNAAITVVHRADGSVWTTTAGLAWVNPYDRRVWDYAIGVAEAAARAGFDEIMLDYMRFPDQRRVERQSGRRYRR